jgi:NAD(P)-dependent dehydrogenase (short-subunit alcohol dehydrogenase family)
MGAGPLSGQVALVTGGGVRIGAAIVEALARAGAAVVIHHRASREDAERLAHRVRAGGGKAWTVKADLAKAKDRGRLLTDAAKAAGQPVTLLVNNASSFPEAKMSDLGFDDLCKALEVNAWAPFALTRTFAEQLPAGRRGSVVNLVDARVADYDWSHVGYWLAKCMLADLTRACAVEYAPAVAVNGVSPGAVLGPSNRPMAAEEEAEFLRRMAKHVPLRRTPTPADIAATVVHLLSSPTTTGVIVPVDGGRHLGKAVYG